MRCLPFLLFFPSVLHADEAKPNTLTPKEIEEGWILLFDGETTYGWKVEGDVKATDGALVLDGSEKQAIVTPSSRLGSYELRFEYRGSASLKVNNWAEVLDKKWLEQAANSPIVGAKSDQWSQYVIKFDLDEKGSGTGLGSETKIRNGQIEESLSSSRTKRIGIMVRPGQKLSIRSVKLKPRAAKSIFNSKDLTGWSVFDDPKRNQSKWTVTTEGWLNVKNGPGDLQTEKKYDDFVLQLECISNGKALNSGIFFRCIANEYQNGYEMQIHNGYKDNDRSKPSDFGTGAIYRRVPARKVVPNDNEWFTMTLVAQGNHIATWINGYQTVDWIDDRKADDNPRRGSKTGAGHISIQGHDPTTDLCFRNLRIVELKKEEKK